MKTKPQTEKQTVKIPIEVFLDVCKMIYTGDLNTKIIGSNETMGETLIEISLTKGNKIQETALHNIYDSIDEWNQLRYGDENPEEVDLN